MMIAYGSWDSTAVEYKQRVTAAKCTISAFSKRGP
jgi:hypothetical protein